MKYQLQRILAFTGIIYAKVTYTGYKVLRFELAELRDYQKIFALKENPMLGLDIWKETSDGKLDLLVPPESYSFVTAELHDLPMSILIDDIEQGIQNERNSPSHLFSRQIPSDHSIYYDSIFSDYQSNDVYMEYLLQNPEAKDFQIGETVHGRPIRGIKFGRGSKNIVVTGGIHAREWISPSTVTYIASHLMSNSTRALSFRERFTFHMIPVLNPDGYEFSRTTDRLWRKNRQTNENSECIGVDLNRNFEFKWRMFGHDDPCAENYRGAAPFSTIEARSLDSYVGSLTNVVSYFDIHSYGQMILFSFGFSRSEIPPDYDDMYAASEIAARTIKTIHLKKYSFGSSLKTIGYGTGGTTDDHFYARHKVKYSMTVELRDTYQYGFLLPADQIRPTGEETVEGLMAFWDYVDLHGGQSAYRENNLLHIFATIFCCILLLIVIGWIIYFFINRKNHKGLPSSNRINCFF